MPPGRVQPHIKVVVGKNLQWCGAWNYFNEHQTMLNHVVGYKIQQEDMKAKVDAPDTVEETKNSSYGCQTLKFNTPYENRATYTNTINLSVYIVVKTRNQWYPRCDNPCRTNKLFKWKSKRAHMGSVGSMDYMGQNNICLNRLEYHDGISMDTARHDSQYISWCAVVRIFRFGMVHLLHKIQVNWMPTWSPRNTKPNTRLLKAPMGLYYNKPAIYNAL